MIITITGNNFYLIKHRLDELVNKFVAEHGELAVDKIDAEEAEPAAILEAVQSLPFLSSRKLVVIRNLSANKLAAEQIEQIIGSAGDGADLIFYELSPDKRTIFYKVLRSQTELEEYNELDVQELARWLVEEAKKLGGKISPADANYLVERVGANQKLIANELDKLLTYEPAISRDNIDRLTVKNPQSKVFDLLDAAFGGRKQAALKLYSEQRAQMVEPQEIVAMIAWQLRLIALAKVTDKTPNQIAADTGSSAYPINKAAGLGRNLSRGDIKRLVNRLYEIDLLAKTKSIDLDEALKTYLVTI
jgi:DNA polymerase-3 subunit delta